MSRQGRGEKLSHMRTTQRELTAGDIGQLVQALLAGIERGELEASAKEIAFLASVADMLAPRAEAS